MYKSGGINAQIQNDEKPFDCIDKASSLRFNMLNMSTDYSKYYSVSENVLKSSDINPLYNKISFIIHNLNLGNTDSSRAYGYYFGPNSIPTEYIQAAKIYMKTDISSLIEKLFSNSSILPGVGLTYFTDHHDTIDCPCCQKSYVHSDIISLGDIKQRYILDQIQDPNTKGTMICFIIDMLFKIQTIVYALYKIRQDKDIIRKQLGNISHILKKAVQCKTFTTSHKSQNKFAWVQLAYNLVH